MNLKGKISTIILNWNRLNSLRATIDSYLATIQGEYELIVVDNASTDGSVEYLREIEKNGRAKVLLLDENVGGLGYNEALHLINGEYIHFSENDQLFLPGWCEHLHHSFETFDDLGQLSFFADVPTDLEAWGPKPSKLRLKNGLILYEAQYNVGTSSAIRAHIIFEKGVRVTNLEGLAYKFPADGKLSADIKAAGYWCAWSDRYYVRNLGHETTEFDADPNYYEGNYASKPWLGIEGWQKRVEAQRAQPKVTRHSVVFPDRHAGAEKTERDIDGKPSRLWSMFDTATPETETIDFLYALTRLLKPKSVLEMNTWIGLGTVAVARGLRENGFGHITTFTEDVEASKTAKHNIEKYAVENWVTDNLQLSDTFVTKDKYDLVIFNTISTSFHEELLRIQHVINDETIIVFCCSETSNIGEESSIQALIHAGTISGLKFQTPRGIFIGRKN
jgi:hypothetical protein